MNYLLLLIPLLTILGFWLLVPFARWLLFRPIEPLNFAGIRLQGILPRYKDSLADKVGNRIGLAFADGSMTGARPDFESIRPVVESHMDDFLRHKLKEKMPMVGMLIGDRTIQDLKTIFIQEIEELFPRVMNTFAGSPAAGPGTGRLVAEKIRSIPQGRLEEMVRPLLEPMFRQLGRLAIATGILIAIIQFCLLLFVHP